MVDFWPGGLTFGLMLCGGDVGEFRVDLLVILMVWLDFLENENRMIFLVLSPMWLQIFVF